MVRVLLDTCAVIQLITDPKSLPESVWNLFDDYENRLFISAETMREMIILFNNKRFLKKYWKTAGDMLRIIENNYGLERYLSRKERFLIYLFFNELSTNHLAFPIETVQIFLR